MRSSLKHMLTLALCMVWAYGCSVCVRWRLGGCARRPGVLMHRAWRRSSCARRPNVDGSPCCWEAQTSTDSLAQCAAGMPAGSRNAIPAAEQSRAPDARCGRARRPHAQPCRLACCPPHLQPVAGVPLAGLHEHLHTANLNHRVGSRGGLAERRWVVRLLRGCGFNSCKHSH